MTSEDFNISNVEPLFKVWYPNLFFYAQEEFNSIEEAKEYGFKKGFHFLVVNNFDGVIEYQSPAII